MNSTENENILRLYGQDILDSPSFRNTEHYIQHGEISVMQHSIAVALTALAISRTLPFHIDTRSLVRGALLHDFFLYDWHTHEITGKHFWEFYKMHGFTHPGTALANARREFDISPVQADIIKKHMWPLTVVPPTCREAWIVTCADKICAARETLVRSRRLYAQGGR